MNTPARFDSPLFPDIYAKSLTGKSYLAHGFSRYISGKYRYHPTLPYALLRGCYFGVVLKKDMWKAFTEVKARDIFQEDDYIPTPEWGSLRHSLIVALHDAYGLAIKSGILVKLNTPYCIGGHIAITAIPPRDKSFPWELWTIVKIVEEFIAEEELYFRVRGEEGLEHYVPAACTNYYDALPLFIKANG